jgi:adenylate kinase
MIKRDIILFGKPGSGKGTLSKTVVKGDTGIIHMSTGDIFREHMKNKTELGLEIIEVMESGELVNDELTCAIVEDFMENLPENKYVIFDGFPRTEQQLNWLLIYCVENDRPIPFFVELDVDDEELIKRIKNRAIDQDRKEDQDERVIKNRLAVYNRQTSIVKDIMNEYVDITKIIKLNGMLSSKKVYISFIKNIESSGLDI